MSAFTFQEYYKLGHNLTWMRSQWVVIANQLLSRAYSPKHSIIKSVATATEDGLASFKFHLQAFARYELPMVDMEYSFYPSAQENYLPPSYLPGCSIEETEQLQASLQKRRLEREKRTPLTIEELRIIAKCFRIVDEFCAEVIHRIRAVYGDDLPLDAHGLFLASWFITDAWLNITREIERVTHEQV
ncbi:MAG: hypothetical protein AB7U29_12725 [Desulfobulbus sp.]